MPASGWSDVLEHDLGAHDRGQSHRLLPAISFPCQADVNGGIFLLSNDHHGVRITLSLTAQAIGHLSRNNPRPIRDHAQRQTKTLPRRFILPSPSLSLDNPPFKLIDQPSPFTRQRHRFARTYRHVCMHVLPPSRPRSKERATVWVIIIPPSLLTERDRLRRFNMFQQLTRRSRVTEWGSFRPRLPRTPNPVSIFPLVPFA